MVEKRRQRENAEELQEVKNQKFQNACKIWFCPAEERIARELRAMPQEEREKVWADLSGNEKTSQFKKDVVEDPGQISQAIEDMKQELNSIVSKEAVDLVQKLAPEYINRRSFQLMFLRASEYKGKVAAQKLVEHMENKNRLFGEGALGRDIKLSDLDEEDMNVLNSGFIQFLEERDTAGRLVLYGHLENLKFKERGNVCRALFYCLMTALQDESVQKFGVVVVWNIMADYNGGHDYETDRLVIKTANAVPARAVARYIIYQCKLWKQVIEVVNHFLSPQLRARTRTIHGSYSEVMYALACLGISTQAIPVSEAGNVECDTINAWIESHKRKENAGELSGCYLSCRTRSQNRSEMEQRKRRKVAV